MIFLDGKKLPQDNTAKSTLKNFHHSLNQLQADNATFLQIIGDRKTHILGRLKEIQSELSEKSTAPKSSAAALIETFQGHHRERVAEVESVQSRVESCEQERDQLYERMRQDAQRRQREGQLGDHHQELEESKAHIHGLSAALEFVQAEQLSMVERVVSVDEQSKALDALSRTSRNMDQKLISQLEAMIQRSKQLVPDIAGESAGYVANAISARLLQLSKLAQQRISSVQSEADLLLRMTALTHPDTESSTRGSVTLCRDLMEHGIGSHAKNSADIHSALSYYETANRACLSLEQPLLQLLHFQQLASVQSRTVDAAQDDAQQMKQEMNSIVSKMEQSIDALSTFTSQETLSLARAGAQLNQDGQLSIDSLSSTFDRDIKAMSRLILCLDAAQDAEVARKLEMTRSRLDEGMQVRQNIHALIKDYDTLQSHKAD
ncbi:hypothetical protein BGZ94_008350 [Podila epigama]|nr:hypothetical protein BGZ94_008350 [Podila epigama]